MKVRLQIPKSSAASESVELVEWCVKVGDRVEKGDTLYVLESEKATLDIPAAMAGTMVSQEPAGAPYPVGAPIGVLDTD